MTLTQTSRENGRAHPRVNLQPVRVSRRQKRAYLRSLPNRLLFVFLLPLMAGTVLGAVGVTGSITTVVAVALGLVPFFPTQFWWTRRTQTAP